MKNIYYFFAIFLSQIIHAQSDVDKNQQLVYTHLYSKEFDKAKNLIDQEYLKSNNLSKNVIGYVYLADYYISNIDLVTSFVDASDDLKMVVIDDFGNEVLYQDFMDEATIVVYSKKVWEENGLI